LACGAGYADQAHMCREFRDLAGTTPQSLLTRVGSTLSMSDLFNTKNCDGD
jgi:AraC-like DNA-binding protein